MLLFPIPWGPAEWVRGRNVLKGDTFPVRYVPAGRLQSETRKSSARTRWPSCARMERRTTKKKKKRSGQVDGIKARTPREEILLSRKR